MVTQAELVALMSPQMERSYFKAKEEALREVYAVNWKHNNEYEKARWAWDSENSDKWETVRKDWEARKDSIREQIAILQQQEREAFEEFKKAEDEVYAEQYRALKHIIEAQKPESEANSIRRQEIEAELLAKYEAKLREKGKVA